MLHPLVQLVGACLICVLLPYVVQVWSLPAGTFYPESDASALASLAALVSGLWFKYTLITRAGFTQGFSIAQRPVRGVRRQES